MAVKTVSYPHSAAELTSAKECADKLTQRPGSSTAFAPAREVHYHTHNNYGGWGPFWGGYHPMPCYSSGSSNRDNDYSWVAIPAALAVLATAYFFGENYAQWQQADSAVKTLQNKQIDVASELNDKPALWGQMRKVFGKHEQVLSAQKSDAEISLMAKGAFGASSAIAFAGALANAGAIVALGAAGALAAGTVMLFRAGFRTADQTAPAALELRSTAEAAERAFSAAVAPKEVLVAAATPVDAAAASA